MCDKKKKNKKKKTPKKLSQLLKSHISGTREAISLKFGMWSAAVGGNVHSKNRLVSSRKHRATEMRKLRFLSSCQYTHRRKKKKKKVLRAGFLGRTARHTTVCLDLKCVRGNGSLFASFPSYSAKYSTVIVQRKCQDNSSSLKQRLHKRDCFHAFRDPLGSARTLTLANSL